jgi:hypothetical protein
MWDGYFDLLFLNYKKFILLARQMMKKNMQGIARKKDPRKYCLIKEKFSFSFLCIQQELQFLTDHNVLQIKIVFHT